MAYHDGDSEIDNRERQHAPRAALLVPRVRSISVL